MATNMKTKLLFFYDTMDCGCEIEESERDAWRAEVERFLVDLYPDQRVAVEVRPAMAHMRMRAVDTDGVEVCDHSDLQAIWERGEFWGQ